MAYVLLLILPIVAFVLFFANFLRRGVDWRRAFLAGAILWGTCIVVITEALSVPRLITRGAVAGAWAIVTIISLLILRVRKGADQKSQASEQVAEHLGKDTKALLIAAAGIVAIVAIVAFVSPPNVWDAMEYHLPRVMLWMNQHSVRFFATPDYAQLVFGPWAEFAMMHIRLLFGTDRFVNFVEFFSLLGSCVAVSLIAKSLGASKRGQALAAVICAVIPEGILEASGPMNTYVVSFWIATTVAFILIANEDPSWANTICIGLAAGLAILTKGSTYVYLPLLVLGSWLMGSVPARVRFLKRSAALLFLIILLNVPQAVRSYNLTGSPLGLPFPDGGPRLHWMADRIGVRPAIANTIRNASLQISTPIQGLNDRLEKATRWLTQRTGENPDDPREVWPDDNFHLSNFSFHEVHAGNPLHFVLLIVAIGFAIFYQKAFPKYTWIYAAGIVGAFLFFCTLLRWQTWGSRHHLPLFVVGSALSALFLERCVSRRLGNVIVVALLVFAVPFALANRTRSLIRWNRVDDVYHPREVLYFSDQHQAIAQANIDAARAINDSGCDRVGVDAFVPLPDNELVHSPRSFFVYPLLSLIGAGGNKRTAWYVGTHNLTKKYDDGQRQPCAVICVDCATHPETWTAYLAKGLKPAVFDYIVVFSAMRDPSSNQAGVVN